MTTEITDPSLALSDLRWPAPRSRGGSFDLDQQGVRARRAEGPGRVAGAVERPEQGTRGDLESQLATRAFSTSSTGSNGLSTTSRCSSISGDDGLDRRGARRAGKGGRSDRQARARGALLRGVRRAPRHPHGVRRGGRGRCPGLGADALPDVRAVPHFQKGFDVTIDEVTAGDEAGIKSATMTVRGAHAYGTLESERGAHRLVRISPFDSNARRHTSFRRGGRHPRSRR